MPSVASKKRAKKRSKSLSPPPAAAAPPRPPKMALWDSEEEGEEAPAAKKARPAAKPSPADGPSPAAEAAESDSEASAASAAGSAAGSASGSDGEEEEPFSVLATRLFETMIAPTKAADFYRDYFGKKPLLHERSEPAAAEATVTSTSAAPTPPPPNPLAGLLTKADIEEYLSRQSLVYGLDLNVTNVVDGARQTLDLLGPGGKTTVVAAAGDVWANVDEGCSVRLLCPHKFSDSVHDLLSTLEQELGCMVGANAYLTPRGGQGFAPHYDDVDVFVLQQEGKKRWRVYEPFRAEEALPRVSSADYDPSKVPKKPYLDVTLKPGDLLYLPRGWVHQAVTAPSDTHSLHLTVSAMQSWAWADLLEHIVPAAVASLGNGPDAEIREGLPRGFLGYMGIQNDNDYLLEEARAEKERGGAAAAGVDKEARRAIKNRTRFRAALKGKLEKVCKEALKLADFGADEMMKRFMSERLPPAFDEEEKTLTNDNPGNGEVCAETLVRIAREGIARIVLEDGKCVLYHCADNNRDHLTEISPMEFEADDAPAIELLLRTAAPHWVKVADLPHPPADDVDDKIEIVKALYEEGIVGIMQPGWISDRVGGKQ